MNDEGIRGPNVAPLSCCHAQGRLLIPHSLREKVKQGQASAKYAQTVNHPSPNDVLRWRIEPSGAQGFGVLASGSNAAKTWRNMNTNFFEPPQKKVVGPNVCANFNKPKSRIPHRLSGETL
jgi:hypothetical protein